MSDLYRLALPADAYWVADGISAPVVISRTEPEYPPDAASAGLEGTVIVAAVIEEDGSASNVRVIRAAGLGFDQKAAGAVAKWRFTPGDYMGHPVKTFTALAVDFRIPHDPSRWHLLGVRLKSDEGVSPPSIRSTVFPHGAGITNDSLDAGQLVVAAGRLATVTLSFQVDKTGAPVGFEVERASDPLWGPEAVAVVRAWRFQPALLNVRAVSAAGEVDLAWGPRELPRHEPPPGAGGGSGAALVHPPIVSQVAPVYTDEALSRKIEGRVLVSLTIDEQGVPRNPRVELSPGYGLGEKAIEAVSQWRFRPIVSAGTAIAVPAKVAVEFRLKPKD